jgi:hypothetical protein
MQRYVTDSRLRAAARSASRAVVRSLARGAVRSASRTATEMQNPRPAESGTTRPPTQQNFPWQLRRRIRLLRAERDEAVRRELAVGTGPEVRRR